MAAVSSRRTLGRSLVRRETASGGDGFFAGPPALAPPATAGQQEQPGPSAMAARITPAVLFITVVLAVVLLVSGLLHILRRLFLKSHHANARAEAVERQLQQLFHLHEDGPGLDQAAIDALPCFAYGELSLGGSEEGEGDDEEDKKKKKGTRPFDCAVCLCEFAADDRLRLLPLCGHAFHVACIDTWLRSSATCPLCRTQALSASAHALAAPPTADTDTPSALETGGTGVEEQQKQDDDASKEDAAFPGSVVLPVRLGRFKNVQGGGGGAAASSGSSSRRLDARRCYSMGSNYRYVLAEDNLVVSVRWRPGDSTSGAAPGGGVATAAARRSEQQGKKVCAASRGDSFSVSKIWQWRGSGRRLPALGRADGSESPAPDDGLPWAQAPVPARTRSARQEIDT